MQFFYLTVLLLCLFNSCLGLSHPLQFPSVTKKPHHSYSALASPSPTPNPVTTDCGPVLGFIDQQIYQYLGIRYAAPPTGDRRWKNTVDVRDGFCFNGTFNAFSFGSSCSQLEDNQIIGSEDCLFLNVYTPSTTSTELRPVLFYIHGGSLITGSGAGVLENPIQFVIDTNTVVVTINYRLNAFGFLALNELSTHSPTQTSGNYGFMDQIQALKWVQNNIKGFGGDPSRVTISGQSSGGTSILALLASPLAKGLFANAWSMSASYVYDTDLNQANAANRIFVDTSGCSKSNDVYSCLMALSADEVVKATPYNIYPFWATPQLFDFPHPNDHFGALGIVDGYIVPHPPAFALRHGLAASNANTVWGSLAQELEVFTPFNYNNYTKDEFISQVINKTFSSFTEDMPQALVEAYDEVLQTYPTQKAFLTMLADVGITCGQNYLGFVQSQGTKNNIYRYYVTRTPTTPITVFGVAGSLSFHGLDLIAAFRTYTNLNHTNDQSIIQFADEIQADLLSLMETGSIPSWPNIQGSGPGINSRVYDQVSFHNEVNFREEYCQLWWDQFQMKDYGWGN